MPGHWLTTGMLLVFATTLAFVAGYGYRKRLDTDPADGPVERFLQERRESLRERFASGEISRQQFAAEIERVEHPETERIMHLARDVDGVGPHIGFNIARDFARVEDLADADVEDLEAINRVGENRARAVLQRARQEREGDG